MDDAKSGKATPGLVDFNGASRSLLYLKYPAARLMYLTNQTTRPKMIASGRAWPTGVAYGVGVSYSDLQFNQVPVRRHSTAGCPYTKWMDVGVPAIPNQILNTVFYLFPDDDSARAGAAFGGSGFIVGVPSSTHPTAIHLYFISNWHVVKKGGHSVVRINRRDGGIDVFPLGPDEWEHLPGGGDVAAAMACLDPALHNFDFFPLNLFHLYQGPNPQRVGIGDDVFLVGRFIDHDGGLSNAPAVRFGNISTMPAAMDGISNSGSDTPYYCLDMHSRTGFSGSPVCVYRTIGQDLHKGLTEPFALNEGPFLKVLGIHCGQFPEELELKDGGVVKGHSGMTIALPADHIVKLLCDAPVFVARRSAIDAQWKGVNFPCPE